MYLQLALVIIFGLLAYFLSRWYSNKKQQTGKAPLKQLLIGYLIFVLVVAFVVLVLILVTPS